MAAFTLGSDPNLTDKSFKKIYKKYAIQSKWEQCNALQKRKMVSKATLQKRRGR